MSGIKAYNHLPQYLKTLDQNSSYFRSSLKCFFYQHPFYTIEEYYEYEADLLLNLIYYSALLWIIIELKC
jgi:hypothetical protein